MLDLAAQLWNLLRRFREAAPYIAQWAILTTMPGTRVLATPRASTGSISQPFCSIQAVAAVILGAAPGFEVCGVPGKALGPSVRGSGLSTRHHPEI